ncbi:unnamed protein product [Brassica rapa]|uniref:UBX domain-containing protein n=1 Tax=Brassica campestris TaxID=3711 RepID=A0A3P6BYR9_BRACM|nr:unnamed protein product [Brassica rapa]VDD11467.1 unnamed protein product [Brassica rapa]
MRDDQQKLISSFMEIAIGQTKDTAIQFLKETSWNLEEAINLFLIHRENQPQQEEHIPPPLPSIRDTLYDSSYMYQTPVQVCPEEIWDAESEPSEDSDTDPRRLSSLYRAPLKLLFQGTFEEAKSTSSRQNLWLLVNLHFILSQVYDDTTEGKKVSTFYRIESAPPVVLLIDPITGQNMRSWSGAIEAHGFVEDLMKYMDDGPHQYMASSTRNKRMKTDKISSESSQTGMPELAESLETKEEEETCSSRNQTIGHIGLPLSWGPEFEKSAEVKQEEICVEFPDLTEEPKGDCDKSLVCSLCVRFPDGSRKQRKFLKTEPIQLLWSFCYSQMVESEKKAFKLVQAIPGASKTLEYGANATFDQSGLANSMISVTWDYNVLLIQATLFDNDGYYLFSSRLSNHQHDKLILVHSLLQIVSFFSILTLQISDSESESLDSLTFDETPQTTNEYQQNLISSFTEVAVGQTMETVIQFLETANWNLEEAINHFFVESNTTRLPPLRFLFEGSFDEAKSASSQENLWLLVNLQSTKNYASHSLDIDLWSNKVVSQAIESSIILWQVYDDTTEGQKISTFYKIESALPVVLLIDPITGFKMRSWSGVIEAQSFIDDLMNYTKSGPHEHIASLTRKEPVLCNKTNQTSDDVVTPSGAETCSSSNHIDHVVAETCSSTNCNDVVETIETKTLPTHEEKEEETCFEFPVLTEEPKGDCDRSLVCSLCVRFPDGRRKQRKFLKTEPIQLLWSFCHSQMVESEKKAFKLVQAIPGASKTLDYGADATFGQSGLANSMVLVAWE